MPGLGPKFNEEVIILDTDGGIYIYMDIHTDENTHEGGMDMIHRGRRHGKTYARKDITAKGIYT